MIILLMNKRKDTNAFAKNTQKAREVERNGYFQKLRPNPTTRSTYNILRCRKETQQPGTALSDV